MEQFTINDEITDNLSDLGRKPSYTVRYNVEGISGSSAVFIKLGLDYNFPGIRYKTLLSYGLVLTDREVDSISTAKNLSEALTHAINYADSIEKVYAPLATENRLRFDEEKRIQQEADRERKRQLYEADTPLTHGEATEIVTKLYTDARIDRRPKRFTASPRGERSVTYSITAKPTGSGIRFYINGVSTSRDGIVSLLANCSYMKTMIGLM